MIASRHMPKVAGPSEWIPRSSGPRCRWRPTMRVTASSREATSRADETIPAIPHIRETHQRQLRRVASRSRRRLKPDKVHPDANQRPIGPLGCNGSAYRVAMPILRKALETNGFAYFRRFLWRCQQAHEMEAEFHCGAG